VTWTVLARPLFTGVSNVVLSPTNPGVVLLSAGGVFKSVDGGNTFVQISGAAGSGLPAGPYALAGDPSNPNRYFAAMPFYPNGQTRLYVRV
jgi:hypothetical protein